MAKPIVVYDVETSGLSAQFDWVIQLSGVKFNRETFEVLGKFNAYIIPRGEWHIHPDATEVHGLTEDFIKANGRPMKEVGAEFLEFAKDCDLMGYNSNQFDALRLYKDFTDSGLPFPMDGIQFYDVLGMERKIHPNNLGAVFERYTGKTMEQAGYKAHDSLGDCMATLDVFKAQMDLLDNDWETINEWQENQLFTPDGTVRNAAKQGEPMLIVFNQGKYRDRDVYDVANEDPGYMKWACEKMFSGYTVALCRKYYAAKKSADPSKKSSSKAKSKR